MHTRLVSPQVAQGLTCSSQLPPSLPQYHHFLPLLSCRHLVRYIPDYLKSHSHCVASPLLTAQGQMQGNGASGGCQRQSYSWKALSHSCSHEPRLVENMDKALQTRHAVEFAFKTSQNSLLYKFILNNIILGPSFFIRRGVALKQSLEFRCVLYYYNNVAITYFFLFFFLKQGINIA